MPRVVQKKPEKLLRQTPLQQPETPSAPPHRSPVGMQPHWPFQQTPVVATHARPFWSGSGLQMPPGPQYWHSGQM